MKNASDAWGADNCAHQGNGATVGRGAGVGRVSEPDWENMMGASEPTLIPFTMRGTQLLSAGQSMEQLARTSDLWVHSKVYAEGGENGLHAHAHEHHMFMVLDGQARFFDASGASTVLSPYDGVVIPPGVAYRFQSVADENLVLLRVGTGAAVAREQVAEGPDDLPAAMMVRVGPDGQERPPTAAENLTGASAGVPADGARFGTARAHPDA